MEIPRDSYTIETFLDYIHNNVDTIFKEKHGKRWLKVYIIYAMRNWRKLFETFETDSYGDILKIYFSDGDNKESKIVFYGCEISSGILLMFTSSRKEDYEKTLKKFILTKKGISQSWIKPALLDKMKYHLINHHEARVYRFIGRRYKHWKYESKIRPEIDRRISYSGNDANEALKELQSLYGVIPSSIDLVVEESKVQINRNGLLLIRNINKITIGLINEVLDIILSEQQRIRDLSEKIIVKSNIIQSGPARIKISQVTAGKIIFSSDILSEGFIENLFEPLSMDPYLNNSLEREEDIQERSFSFIDTNIQGHPFFYTAIVIDENKKSIFGISGNDREITLVPKHRITFESFINFYNYIAENIDDDASLIQFGEIVAK